MTSPFVKEQWQSFALKFAAVHSACSLHFDVHAAVVHGAMVHDPTLLRIDSSSVAPGCLHCPVLKNAYLGVPAMFQNARKREQRNRDDRLVHGEKEGSG